MPMQALYAYWTVSLRLCSFTRLFLGGRCLFQDTVLHENCSFSRQSLDGRLTYSLTRFLFILQAIPGWQDLLLIIWYHRLLLTHQAILGQQDPDVQFPAVVGRLSGCHIWNTTYVALQWWPLANGCSYSI